MARGRAVRIITGAPMTVGVMFFTDPARSFGNLRKGLSPAGASPSPAGAQDLDLDIAIGRGLDRVVSAALAIEPTNCIHDGQSEAVRTATTTEVRKAPADRAKGDSVPLGATIWIVTAVNSGEGRLAHAETPAW